jgi:hypothetical protein
VLPTYPPTQQPSNPATQQPSYPATQLPSNPATHHGGDGIASVPPDVARAGGVAEMPDPTPYRQSVEQVVTGLGTDVTRGLTDDDASERLRRYGRNELAAAEAVPAVTLVSRSPSGFHPRMCRRRTLSAADALVGRRVRTGPCCPMRPASA